jgi:putative inorganic carbon (hco3(-)) transporter
MISCEPTSDDFLLIPDPEGVSRQAPYWALLVYLTMMLTRPWDYITALAAVHPMVLFMAITIGLFLLGHPRIEFLSVRPMKLFLAYMAAICWSVVFSYWPTNSLTLAVEFLRQILMFTLVVNLISTLGRLRGIVTVVSACCAYHGAKAIYAFATGTGDRLQGFVEPYFGDPNDLALSLTLVLPLTWWLGATAKSRLGQLAAYGAILLMVGGILSSQSRGGLLALIAAAGVLFVRLEQRQRIQLMATTAVAVILAVAVLPEDTFSRYSTITEYEKDESAQIRLAIWKSGLQMFADHPLTGTGPGTFEIVYGKSYINRNVAGNTWRAAHSSYIELAAELGLGGFLIWVSMQVTAFVSLFRSHRLLKNAEYEAEDWVLVDQLRKWNTALLAAMTGYLIGAAFLSRGYDMLQMMVFALIAVLVRGTEVVVRHEEE